MRMARNFELSKNVLIPAVTALSVIAALIHLWVVPAHLKEWWGYGNFFIICAGAEILYAALLARWPNRTVFVLGMIGNSAVVLLWLFTRTVGIPLGSEAWEVESVGTIDVCATITEASTVLLLGVLLVSLLVREKKSL